MAVPASLWRRARSLDPLVEDGALAAALLLVSAWGLLTPGLLTAVLPGLRGSPPSPGLIPLTALMIAPVVVRRRWPTAAYVVQVLAWLLAARLSGRWGITVSSVAALLVVAYSAGFQGARRGASLAIVAAGSAVLVVGSDVVTAERFGRLPRADDLDMALDLLIVALPVTSWLAGASMHARSVRRRLERESAERSALAGERSRIARELHDVVAHGLSVMIVQAEAGRRLLTRDPARAAEAMRTISAAGAEALDELERLLRVLAAGDGRAAREPDPGLATLEGLLARVRATGVDVELCSGGEARALPRGLDVTAYRIVQEALTNVIKHAAGARAVVRLDYLPDHLGIEVVDDGRAAAVAAGAGGRGLLGMRERVAAFGGELEAGPRPGGGYAVRALLPLAGPD